MDSLPAILGVGQGVAPTQGSWRDASARAAGNAPSPQDIAAWHRAYQAHASAWNAWRASQPAVGYVVQRLTQEHSDGGSDPGRRIRGNAVYAAAAARDTAIEGPVGAVSLLV